MTVYGFTTQFIKVIDEELTCSWHCCLSRVQLPRHSSLVHLSLSWNANWILSSSFPQLENIRYHWCHISILAKLRSPCVKCYFTAYIMSCSNELTINIECNCLKYYCEVQNYMWKCLVCFEKGRSCLCSGYMLSYIEILVRYFSAKIMQACPYRWSWI